MGVKPALTDAEHGFPRTLVLALLSAGAVCLLYARFNAVNGVVLPFLQKAASPQLYALDFNIAHSLVPRSSALFDLLRITRTDLTAPAFVVVSYVVLTALSLAAVWRVLARSFGVADISLRAALCFALAFADFKLIGLNKSSWIFEHNFSLTFVAATLRLWFLCFALERRFVAMAALLIPINLISFKVGWPAVGFAALLLLQARERSPAAWGLLLLSLAPPAMSALQSQADLAPGEAAAIFASLAAIHAPEDNPFAGPWVQIPLYVGGTAFAWAQAGRLDAAVAARVRAILYGSLLIYVLGGLALTFGGALLPLPPLVLLSPARALEVASFLIYLIALLWIARTTMLVGIERVVAALALILLKVTPDLKWVLLAVLVAGAAIALRLACAMAQRYGLRWPGIARRIELPLGLALVAPFAGLFFALNLSGQRTAYRYDPALGFYPAGTPADALPMLRAIAAQPGDRRIVFAWPLQGWSEAPWRLNVRKSGIAGDPYYLPRLDQIRQQFAANAVQDRVLKGIAGGRIDPDAASALARANATLVLPAAAASAAPGWRAVESFGGWVELAPPTAASAKLTSQGTAR